VVVHFGLGVAVRELVDLLSAALSGDLAVHPPGQGQCDGVIYSKPEAIKDDRVAG